MQTYLVGGAIRDRLLNLPVGERDWVVVGATAHEMKSKGFKQVGKDFPVFLHPESGEEYALARTERKTGKGHTGFIVHSSPEISLQEDLFRRDLTINAMAEDHEGNLVDPYNGQQDLQNRILRHVSPAFMEDPLRVLRVARFAAKLHYLDFQVAEETLALMKKMANSGELQTLPKERIWQETLYALETNHPEVYFFTLLQSNALSELCPKFAHALDKPDRRAQIEKVKGLSGSEERFTAITLIAGITNLKIDSDTIDAIKHSFITSRNLDERITLAGNYYARCVNSLDQSSGEIFSLLHSLDAFRRPGRCTQILSSINSVFQIKESKQSESVKFLLNITPQLAELSLDTDIQKNLQGEQIAIALKDLRCQEITTALEQFLNKSK